MTADVVVSRELKSLQDELSAAQVEERKGCLGFDPRRHQTAEGSRAAQTAEGNVDRCDHEGDRMAATLGARFLRRRRA
jgi:hypothetical protein